MIYESDPAQLIGRMATFRCLGATGTVTGSKRLMEAAEQLVLVDCGLYRGRKALRLRNWERLPVKPASVGPVRVVLTHANAMERFGL